MKTAHARAPAKIIFSGEHAVLYGAPALACSINCYVNTTATLQKQKNLYIDLLDYKQQQDISFAELKEKSTNIADNYQLFLAGKVNINEVLANPNELIYFTVQNLINHANIKLQQGFKITIQSAIPAGCGMGSSAAIIASILSAVANVLNVKLAQYEIFDLALQSEHLVHGKSSGLDLQLIMQGGALYYHEQQLQSCNIANFPMMLVNSGTPKSSTGECVAFARKFFENSNLSADFAAITLHLKQACLANDVPEILRAIRENNKLLINIKVVPEAVQDFIQKIERRGGAAKICGAGSVAGNNGGAILVAAEDLASLTLEKLCSKYKYHTDNIELDHDGITINNS